jgi:hypothetical protein
MYVVHLIGLTEPNMKVFESRRSAAAFADQQRRGEAEKVEIYEIEAANPRAAVTAVKMGYARFLESRSHRDSDDEMERARKSQKTEVSISRREIEEVVRQWFRQRGKRPTKAQMEKAIRQPKVIAEAKRRAAVIAEIAGGISLASLASFVGDEDPAPFHAVPPQGG